MSSKLPVTCDKCRLTFDMFAVGIFEQMLDTPYGKLKVSYSFCPQCFKVCVVDIDSDEISSMQRDIESIKDRIEKCQRKNLTESAIRLAKLSHVKTNKKLDSVLKLKSKIEGNLKIDFGSGISKLVYIP